MKLIKEMNLLENKKLILWLNVFSIGLIFAFLPIFGFIAGKIAGDSGGDNDVMGIILGVVSFFALIVIHELIHGLFFKLFNPKGRVKFGFKNGMAYAASPHSLYSKGRFACISLAPFVLITFSLTLLLSLGVISAFYYVMAASIHGAACVGDFYWIYLILKAPKHALVEDTDQGINFYLT